MFCLVNKTFFIIVLGSCVLPGYKHSLTLLSTDAFACTAKSMWAHGFFLLGLILPNPKIVIRVQCLSVSVEKEGFSGYPKIGEFHYLLKRYVSFTSDCAGCSSE